MRSTTRWVRRNWQWLIGPGTVALAALICWFINTGEFLVMPGGAFDTSTMVKLEPAAPKSGAGKLFLMTVYSGPANVDEWIFGHIYPNARLVPASTQLPPNTSFEHFQHIEQAMMANSQTTAKVVALRELGYSVPEHGGGAVVDSVEQGSAAAKAGIKKGDLIVAVDSQTIETDQQLVIAVSAKKPGDHLTLLIKPNNSDAGHSVDVTLGSRPGQTDKPFLGVALMTYQPRFDFPVQINIDSKGIIGPSAGLILTMSIVQALSPTDITHGHNIAATGTIDLQGNVGPIGDVRDKVIAAEGKAAYFLVPKQDYAAAKEQAKGINVVEIDNVDQATKFLAGLH